MKFSIHISTTVCVLYNLTRLYIYNSISSFSSHRCGDQEGVEHIQQSISPKTTSSVSAKLNEIRRSYIFQDDICI